MTELPKPAILHDRAQEWAALSRFATDDRPGATLGIVYGRRRQGKTLLLDLLARQTGGFVFTALPQSSKQNLDRLSRAVAAFTDSADLVFREWEAAVDALLRVGERGDRPALIFIDEFSYLVYAEPALPSFLQIALGPTSRAATRSKARLVLCGSALSTMRGLLAGPAPLRGRAVLEMMVHPFRFRDAAAFWGLADQPDVAFRVHALVGGTPAYREMAPWLPTSDRDFDDWVVAGPLGPASALFREGAVLLQEQPELTDTRLYYAVLSAVVRGYTRRSEIATALGRSDQSLSHPLAVLESTQLIERVEDPLRKRRPYYRIAEPMLRTHHLLVGPHEADLVGGAGRRVWQECADLVASRIYGPHLEELARQWCHWYADPATLGGRASTVRPATIACPTHRRSHELDVVVVERRPYESDVVRAIGEVKSTTGKVDGDQLARLEHLRELLPADRLAGPPRLLLFSRGGFTKPLQRTAASRDDVELVDMRRLYHGS
ncbi:MAG TPA: ATP-binding protein [Natronosporangium sp.]